MYKGFYEVYRFLPDSNNIITLLFIVPIACLSSFYQPVAAQLAAVYHAVVWNWVLKGYLEYVLLS